MPDSQGASVRKRTFPTNYHEVDFESSLFIPDSRFSSNSLPNPPLRQNTFVSNAFREPTSSITDDQHRGAANGVRKYVIPDDTSAFDEEEEEEETDAEVDAEQGTVDPTAKRRDFRGMYKQDEASVDANRPTALNALNSQPETLLQPLVSLIADAVVKSLRAEKPSSASVQQNDEISFLVETIKADTIDHSTGTSTDIHTVLNELLSQSNRLLQENQELNSRCQKSEDEAERMRAEIANIRSSLESEQALKQTHTQNIAENQSTSTTSSKVHISAKHDIDRYIDHYEDFTLKMQNKTKDLEGMIMDLRSSYLKKDEKLTADVSSIHQRVDKEEAQVRDQFAKSLEVQKATETRISEETRNLKEDYNTVLQRVQITSGLVDSLQGRIEQLQREVSSSSAISGSELANSTTETLASLNQHNTEFADLKIRTGRVEHTIAALTTRYNNISTKELARKMVSVIQPLPNRIQQQQQIFDDQFVNLQTQVDRVEQLVNVAGDGIKNNSVNLEGLVNARVAFEAGVDKKQEDLQESVKQARDKIHGDINDLQKVQTRIQNRLSHIERKVSKPVAPASGPTPSKAVASRSSKGNDDDCIVVRTTYRTSDWRNEDDGDSDDAEKMLARFTKSAPKPTPKFTPKSASNSILEPAPKSTPRFALGSAPKSAPESTAMSVAKPAPKSALNTVSKSTKKTVQGRYVVEKQTVSAKRKRRVLGENCEEEDQDFDNESESSESPVPRKRRR